MTSVEIDTNEKVAVVLLETGVFERSNANS